MHAHELWIHEEGLIAEHDILIPKSADELIGGDGTATDDLGDIADTYIDGLDLAHDDLIAVHGLYVAHHDEAIGIRLEVP